MRGDGTEHGNIEKEECEMRDCEMQIANCEGRCEGVGCEIWGNREIERLRNHQNVVVCCVGCVLSS